MSPKIENTVTGASCALAVQNSEFCAISEVNINDLFGDELNGLELNFERIKIPAGGGLAFEVPGEDAGSPCGSESEMVKEFSGVIIHQHVANMFYEDAYKGGSNPPDCSSINGVTGTGTPGGLCANCPKGQFGSGENGAKACKDKRRMFIQFPNEMLPRMITLPTGSLRPFTAYITRLLTKGRKPSTVVTRFSLKKANNAGGISYSQVMFSMDRVLTAEEQAAMKPMSEWIKAYASKVGIDTDSTAAEESAPMVDPETGEVIQPLT